MEKDNMAMLLGSVKHQIESLEKEAEKYAKSMEEEYEYFFRWYAEDMYKVQRELTELRALRLVMETSEADEVAQYIKAVADGYTDDLLWRPLRRQSTSEATNLAQALWLEVEQKLRKRYMDMLNFISRQKA